MKKSHFNFINDTVMFLVMMAIVGLGFLMKYNLIPGEQRWLKYGRNVDLYLFGLDRHQWGTIHLILGFILLGLLALHIILHWKVILSMYRQLIRNNKSRKKLGFTFIIVSLILIILPLILKPEIRELIKGEGRFGRYSSTKAAEILTPGESSKKSGNSKENHRHINSSVDVAGYMTIADVTEKYNIPHDYLIEKLDMPERTSLNERLGRLRRKYGFKMSDVERIIEEYYKSHEW